MWLIRFKRKGRCEATQETLSAYIDQRLSSAERQVVEHHLASCQACQKELALLQATIGLLHSVPEVLPSRSFTLAEVKPLPRRTAFRALRTATAVVAVFLAVVFVGDMVHLFETQPETFLPSPGEEEGEEEEEEEEEESPSQRTDNGVKPFCVEGLPGEEQSPGGEEPGALSGDGEAGEAQEWGWLQPLEFALLGVVVVLAGVTIAS